VLNVLYDSQSDIAKAREVLCDPPEESGQI